MPSTRYIAVQCVLALAFVALPLHAAEPWSNDYAVPHQQPLPQAAAPRAGTRASTSSPAFDQLCRPGNRVEALAAGQWYEAHVLGADSSFQTCDVTYTGFGKHFDATVNFNRLRPFTGNVAPPPKPAAGQAKAGDARAVPAVTAPTCSAIPRIDGMGNTHYCY